MKQKKNEKNLEDSEGNVDLEHKQQDFDTDYYFKERKFLPCELAEEIAFTDAGYTKRNYIVIKDNQDIWSFNGSFYECDGERQIKAAVQRKIGFGCKPYMKNEVISCIKDNKHLWMERDSFDNYIDVINLIDGIYDIEEGKLIPHGENYLFTYEIPVYYDPVSKCPVIIKFLNEILKPEDILIVQELFGYCLYTKYHIHKAFIFIGDGANGKSTLLRLLTKLIGKSNISAVPLQVIGKDKFAAYDLYGKFANICADIPNTALRDTGIFKMITGEDYIRGEKKFQDAFGFTNYAKLIFSANQLPPAPTDQSDAFFRRWIPINFPNRFIGSKCDKNIFDKISTPDEMSGLLNWAIEGLNRLLKNQEFSNYSTIEETRNYWNKASDVVAEFIHETLEEDTKGTITKEEVYNQYKQFCRNKSYPTIASNVFSRRFKKATIFNIEEGQRKKGGKKTWKGLKWKEKEEVQTGIVNF